MVNRWGKSENSDRFYFLGLQSNCGQWLYHKIKRQFAPWKISYAKPRQHVKKQRHHFAGKGPYSQSSGFTVVIDECESWTIKQAELQRIDSFELWCQRRLLRVPWIARSSKQSILKEINSEINQTMQMTTPLWQKAKKRWRAAWWKWKRRVKKLA